MVFKVIENPEVLTTEERKYFLKCESILKELLLDLKKNDKLKQLLEMPVNSHKIIDTCQRLNEAYNMIIPIFKNTNSMNDFIKNNIKFGINEKDLPYLFASLLIGTMINSSESFRNNLLTILKLEDGFYEKMGLGALLYQLELNSPAHGNKLNEEIDSRLRNALVHGTYWIDGNHIMYCENMKLENPQIKPLHELMIDMKNANIMNVCLFNLMVTYAVKGFFN